MNAGAIKTLTLEVGELDRREILRYMGCRSSTPELEALIDRCAAELDGVLGYRACYGEFEISTSETEVRFPFASARSRSLARTLSGCERAVIFGATVGIGIDRKTVRYGISNPSAALCMQAIGAERTEALCDALCERLSKEYGERGHTLRPRFSPGYGDLSLDFQRDVFRVLGCASRIGLTLGENLLMSPTKSVTAIVGIC